MFNCKSKKHWWTIRADAEKCCNGYVRVLVLGGGDNQQECAGIFAGRAWIKSEQMTLRGNVGPDPNCPNCSGKGGILPEGSCGECWTGTEKRKKAVAQQGA